MNIYNPIISQTGVETNNVYVFVHEDELNLINSYIFDYIRILTGKIIDSGQKTNPVNSFDQNMLNEYMKLGTVQQLEKMKRDYLRIYSIVYPEAIKNYENQKYIHTIEPEDLEI